MNENQKVIWYAKGIFISAIKIGAGLVIGKNIGHCLLDIMDATADALLRYLAERDVPHAIEICRKFGVSCNKKSKFDQFEDRTIGFRVE